MFDMLECGPTWDYTAGGAMLLVVASGLNTKLVKETCGRVQVMFDKTQVWLCICDLQACCVSVLHSNDSMHVFSADCVGPDLPEAS